MTSTYGDTHDERARELAGTGTSVRRTGKGALADLREALGLSAEGSLTRAEDAYAHLASFQRGDVVDVGGRAFFQPGTVTTPQQHDHADINRAYLVVTGCGVETRVTVGSLLSGRFTITSIADAKAGHVRYFDEAGYAAQTCGECGEQASSDGVSAGHGEACSLHPGNVVAAQNG